MAKKTVGQLIQEELTALTKLVLLLDKKVDAIAAGFNVEDVPGLEDETDQETQDNG